MGAYKGGKVYCHQLLTATLMEMNANFTIRPFYTGEVLLVPNDWRGGGGGAFGEAVNFLPLQRIET